MGPWLKQAAPAAEMRRKIWICVLSIGNGLDLWKNKLFQLSYHEIAQMEETCKVMRDYIDSSKVKGFLRVPELYYNPVVSRSLYKTGSWIPSPMAWKWLAFRLGWPSLSISTQRTNIRWSKPLTKQQPKCMLKYSGLRLTFPPFITSNGFSMIRLRLHYKE